MITLDTIAITGESGFLGYHLNKYFKGKYEVVKIGRNYLNNLNLIRDCKFIIHAAGVNRGDYDSVYNGNINIAIELVKELNRLDIKIPIKYISSTQEGNDSAYGLSKLESKKILEIYCLDSSVKFESYKLPNLFGTHGKPNYNSVVNTFAYNLVNNFECVYNENEINLCWVYDAIEVVDNLKDDYKLIKTKVSDLFFLLKGLNEYQIDPITYLSDKLNQVLNYYKSSKKILILGHNGMLGSMVLKYFKSKNLNVHTTDFKYHTLEFEKLIKSEEYDYIINCIGSVPQKTTNFKINIDLPIWLSNNTNSKILHPSTDCEVDNTDYGISKRLATEYILNFSDNTKIIKTSFIGPEVDTNYGLMSWFLSKSGNVDGYTNAIWNGVTTLEWSKQALDIINNWDKYDQLNILEGQPISKYEMLVLIKENFNKEDINIIPIELGKNKCLFGNIKVKSLSDQMIELKKFIQNETHI